MISQGDYQKKSLVYLGHYNNPNVTGQNRCVSLAATTKMDYITDVLNQLGYKVKNVSMALPVRGESGDSGTFDLGGGNTLQLYQSRPRTHKLNGLLNRVSMRRAIRKKLESLSSDDIVLCYHSLDYCGLLQKAKAKAGFRLVLEVEELYSDVTGSNWDFKKETELFKVADAFIFPTELLAEAVSLNGRLYAICSGVYQSNEITIEKRNDGKTHVVYAGTLDPRKGGIAAVAAGAFLDDDYEMHILGSGNNEQVALIENAAENVNKNGKGCKVTYEGVKQGDEFQRFIQSCHIGLSPQNIDAAFNGTSFPSKVFMYLSNGLSVVSVELPVFTGAIREQLVLCSGNSPQELAEAIKRAASRNTEMNPEELLSELSCTFRINLQHLLEEVV